MKARILFICFVLLSSISQGQNIKLPTSNDVKKAKQNVNSEAEKVTGKANIGSLIGQLVNGISDNSFTNSFKKNKNDFISKTKNVTDPAGASSALQSLQGGLLPSAMDAGWRSVKDKWIKDAKTAKTVKSVAGITGTLESHIDDKNFKGNWTTARPAWQAALSALAK